MNSNYYTVEQLAYYIQAERRNEANNIQLWRKAINALTKSSKHNSPDTGALNSTPMASLQAS